ETWIPQNGDERDQFASLRGHLNRVIVEARDYVRAAADERLECLRSARVILQFDIEAFLAIEAELARQRRRKVDQLILAADRDAPAPDCGARLQAANAKDAKDRIARDLKTLCFVSTLWVLCVLRVPSALLITLPPQ